MRKYLIFLIIITFIIPIILMACARKDAFEKVDNIGWKRKNINASFTDKEYKEKCSVQLTFKEYKENPQQYKYILYYVDGIILKHFPKDENGPEAYLIYSDNNEWWISEPFVFSTEFSTGDRIVMYGELVNVMQDSLQMIPLYVEIK